MAHEHGSHKCYCPNCGYEVEADAYIKCNTLSCPNCGTRMRATETGEFRSPAPITTSRITATQVGTDSIPCPVCKYPIQAPTSIGQQVKCAYCGTISEAILQEGITIPTPVFVGIVCFGLGVVLGPSVWATTQGGSEWLAKKARERIG